MCMITLYKGSIDDENKLADGIASYKLDLASGKLTVYPTLEEPQEFVLAKGISWDESNDSMIIE